MGKIMETPQFAEFVSAVVRCLPRDMDATTSQSWITNQPALEKALRGALMPPEQQASGGEPPKEEKKFLSSEIAAKYGYTVVEDLDARTEFTMQDLEYIGFLESGETYINGKTMRKRAKKLNGFFSLADGMYMLEHQDEIPVEFRGNNYIVLAGTLRRDSDGGLHVACLGWDGEQWVLDFDWVGGGPWGGGDRLPRCKSAK